ncbi:N-acetyl sugar amidotransferase [Gracilimonas sp.]|uniref:N-acetyl sugar amidotransferase n=1 Tax=Gracilimonas sp. TaxID=1974203 RepID=UPI0032EB7823
MDYQICTYCVMDTTDPNITFDENGRCHHCKSSEAFLKSNRLLNDKDYREKALKTLVEEIKRKQKGSKYDCIIGVSGGVDSSYTAYRIKKLGLNPLAVHFDNGWNSELANKNIEHICDSLDIDLFTYVIDWEEFKDLQLSFLKASTPDSEIPTDHAIKSLLYQQASKWGVKYILTGQNSSSESILPKAWSQGHDDWRYIKNVQKEFGSVRLKSFPHRNFAKQLWDRLVYNKVQFLNYVEYDKNKAKQFLIDEINWRDYGGKHHESFYTKIYQSYILPEKFGFDKRKAHLSSLIVAGQIDREEALKELETPLYDSQELKRDIEYLLSKFDIEKEEFEDIMSTEPKTYWDYPNSIGVLLKRKLKKVLKR